MLCLSCYNIGKVQKRNYSNSQGLWKPFLRVTTFFLKPKIHALSIWKYRRKVLQRKYVFIFEWWGLAKVFLFKPYSALLYDKHCLHIVSLTPQIVEWMAVLICFRSNVSFLVSLWVWQFLVVVCDLWASTPDTFPYCTDICHMWSSAFFSFSLEGNKPFSTCLFFSDTL